MHVYPPVTYHCYHPTGYPMWKTLDRDGRYEYHVQVIYGVDHKESGDIVFCRKDSGNPFNHDQYHLPSWWETVW